MIESVDDVVDLSGSKIRPQGVGKKQLGIGGLPKKKIGQAHFSAGADNEIRRRHDARIDGIGDVLFRQRPLAAANERIDGVYDFSPSAIVYGNTKNFRTRGGQMLHLGHFPFHAIVEYIPVADKQYAHIIFLKIPLGLLDICLLYTSPSPRDS